MLTRPNYNAGKSYVCNYRFHLLVINLYYPAFIKWDCKKQKFLLANLYSTLNQILIEFFHIESILFEIGYIIGILLPCKVHRSITWLKPGKPFNISIAAVIIHKGLKKNNRFLIVG